MTEHAELEVKTERDYDYLSKREVVRVRYRQRGTRRWSRVLVVPQEGQTVGQLMNHAAEIAAAHARGEHLEVGTDGR